LGSNPSPTITPFSLGYGGNAITLFTKLYARMRQEAALPETGGALENALALANCDDQHQVVWRAPADARYLAAPVDIIRRVLVGEFSLDDSGNKRVIARYFFTFQADFGNYPRPSQALWLYSQMIRWGQRGFFCSWNDSYSLVFQTGYLPHGPWKRRRSD
jgi:hypothetical protein